MSEVGYIVIPNWDGAEGFQHYRDRDPIWIKNYRTLMAKDEYLALSFHCRGILHGLWLEYAASNRQIRDSTLTLTRRLGQRVTTRDLETLNDAGFIELSASRPLAPRYHSRASRDVDVEKEKKDLKTGAHAQETKGVDFATNVAAQSKREHRPYDPPRNPAGVVRLQIIRGVITDLVTLEAELTALGVNGAQADALRALLPTGKADPA